MLFLVMFPEARPILISLADGSDPSALSEPSRLLAALQASGYEELPSAFVALAPGADIVIGELDTGDVASADELAAQEALDVSEVWAPTLSDALCALVLEAEDAADMPSAATYAESAHDRRPAIALASPDMVLAGEAAAFPEVKP